MTDPTSTFAERGRAIVDAALPRLEAGIPGAQRGRERRLAGHDVVTVHFLDAELPVQLAVWLFAAERGAANSSPGAPDAIGVGLKHAADEELDRGAWRFRRLAPFAWRRHIDARHEGFRWFCPVDDLAADPVVAGVAIADRVLRTLHTARAISGP